MNLLFEQQHSLREEIIGNTCICYHRSPDANYHDFLLDYKVAFGKNAGLLDGPGIYTTYDLKSQFKDARMVNIYGPYVFKMRARLDRVLIFDWDQFQKTNRSIGTTKENFIIKQFEELGINKNRVIVNPQQIQKLVNSSKLSSSQQHFFSEIAKKKFKKIATGLQGPCSGILFTGYSDGKVLVMWDAYSVVPYAVANAPSHKMNYSQLQWSLVKDPKSMTKFSQNQNMRSIEIYSLPKIKILDNNEDLKKVINSMEVKEFCKLTGAKLSSTPKQVQNFTIQFTLPDGRDIAVYSSGYIRKNSVAGATMTPFTEKNSYIRKDFTGAILWLLEKAKNKNDRYFYSDLKQPSAASIQKQNRVDQYIKDALIFIETNVNAITDQPKAVEISDPTSEGFINVTMTFPKETEYYRSAYDFISKLPKTYHKKVFYGTQTLFNEIANTEYSKQNEIAKKEIGPKVFVRGDDTYNTIRNKMWELAHK